ncbi:ABC transporter substrate-binding protein [Thalassobacillus devorans]|uniref:ABC transporter substrate-binding protein n=1 Tax=Thalassobacillus devorans TaxID=279813 RepID=UPI000A1CECAE|nr:extracellular solute-binding protein [Thalassobacillus devorans]
MAKITKAWMIGLLAFILILTGCSSDTDGSVEGETENNEENGDTVTLEVGSWRTEDTAKYEKLFEAFNEKHPDIQLEFKPSKNTEYNTILNTALQSGEGPDIMQLRPYAAGAELADAGYLEPIEDLEGLDTFPDSSLMAAQGSDGTQYGVPLNMSTTQMFYNKKIFDELGLEEPQTYEEFIELNETFKSEGYTPLAMGTKEGWLMSLMHGIVGPAHYGANEFVEQIENGETDFVSDEYVASIEAMEQLKDYFPDNSEGLGMEDIRTLFFTEQAAMFPLGSWEIEVLKEMNPDLELDFFPMPSAVGKEPTITTWVDGSYAINANSEHKEEAKKFLEWMTTEEFGQMFTEEFSMVSAVPGVESDNQLVSDLAQAADEISTPYLILVHFAKGNPSSKAELETELQGMYLGEQTPEGVAEAVQKSAEGYYEPFQN